MVTFPLKHHILKQKHSYVCVCVCAASYKTLLDNKQACEDHMGAVCAFMTAGVFVHLSEYDQCPS